MWSMVLELMTHMEEDERKNVLVLLDSTSVVMDVDANLSSF